MLMKFLGPGKRNFIQWNYRRIDFQYCSNMGICQEKQSRSPFSYLRCRNSGSIFNNDDKSISLDIHLQQRIIQWNIFKHLYNISHRYGNNFFFYYKNRKRELPEQSIRKGKPLDLQGALLFAAIYTVILFVVSYAGEHLGDYGLIISGAIAGLSDIDAITITVSSWRTINKFSNSNEHCCRGRHLKYLCENDNRNSLRK